ncbi:MAG: DEAD/DEAH box helicase [Actinomycetota bacterium]|nr:DEAD/DEAH box helicase [Actinomycetota bacterium]
MSSLLAGCHAPVPTFAELGVLPELVGALARRDISSPLPIQAATIADALAGRDVCGKAPTGSGKTLAFSIPLAAAMRRSEPRRPRGLVLAPTRELAAQIAEELSPLLAARKMRAHPFYGGVGFGGQQQALRKGIDVAVACPGRLEDLLERGELRLDQVEVVVIDEADRMADMGFLPAVRRILDKTVNRRQTLLFSATLDGEVDVLVRNYQHDPARHEVEVDEDDLGRATHRFHAVDAAGRAALCAELIGDAGASVVFVRTKHGAERVAKQLDRVGVRAAAIHGDRSQAQRERALSAFRDGKVQALVATDVAARGIHVDDVACVIHFDLPEDPKTYVHRSGRTARAGASGTVIALVTPEMRRAAASLQRALAVEVEHVGDLAPLPAERPAGSRPRPSGRPGGARPVAEGDGRRRNRPARPPRHKAAAAASRQGPRSATRGGANSR